MSIQNIQFITPEIVIIVLALALLLVDLLLKDEQYVSFTFSVSKLLTCILVIGLLVVLGLISTLWLGLDCKANYFAMSWMTCNENTVLSANFKYLTIDKFSLMAKFLLVSTTILVGIVSSEYFSKSFKFKGEYYSLLLFSLLGMMLLVSSTEMITLYVALELSTLPLIALSAITRSNSGLEASLKFIILSAVSSAFLLYGLVMLYGLTGTTDLANINNAVNLQSSISNMMLLAIILVVVGFGFKLTAVPFHMWTPDVYQGSPLPITIFLSIASKIAAITVAIRLFHDNLSVLSDDWVKAIFVLAVASMSLGNLVALTQNNVKRMLAYSSIAHSGYMLIGLALLPTASNTLGTGGSAIIFYLVGYALMNLAAFSIIYIVKSKTGDYNIGSFQGFGYASPILGISLTIALISLIGLPPSVGFMGKFYLFTVAIDHGMTWLVVIGVINSVVSAYYYLRIVKSLYSNKQQNYNNIPIKKGISVVAILCTIGIIVLGVYPGYFIGLAEEAIKVLLPPV
ncbi:MAG: NADH-quinone oxidoreductase subunit N [SAR202 cluster bacterium]|nr:NADH-quinone oxidoreductase subunit N [SAR202 cluster bacterium]